jgi:hypothetical protein
MPQVGGDPIVESGSNSDGEWTRWSDGTQILTGIGSGTSSGTSGSDLPLSFITNDYFITGHFLGSGTLNPIIIKFENVTATGFDAGLLTTGDTTYSPTYSTAIFAWSATGRWK